MIIKKGVFTKGIVSLKGTALSKEHYENILNVSGQFTSTCKGKTYSGTFDPISKEFTVTVWGSITEVSNALKSNNLL